MAGIPEDAVQIPTPAAPSPGLPPVDPIPMAEVDRVDDSPALPPPATQKKRATSRQEGTSARGKSLAKVARDNRS